MGELEKNRGRGGFTVSDEKRKVNERRKVRRRMKGKEVNPGKV